MNRQHLQGKQNGCFFFFLLFTFNCENCTFKDFRFKTNIFVASFFYCCLFKIFHRSSSFLKPIDWNAQSPKWCHDILSHNAHVFSLILLTQFHLIFNSPTANILTKRGNFIFWIFGIRVTLILSPRLRCQCV